MAVDGRDLYCYYKSIMNSSISIKTIALTGIGLLCIACTAVAEKTVLTDQQISQLKIEHTDKDTQKTYKVLNFTARPATIKSRSVKAKYTKSGKALLNFTFALYEIDNSGKKTRQKGTCHLFVKNADGDIIIQESIPLVKMCPT